MMDDLRKEIRLACKGQLEHVIGFDPGGDVVAGREEDDIAGAVSGADLASDVVIFDPICSCGPDYSKDADFFSLGSMGMLDLHQSSQSAAEQFGDIKPQHPWLDVISVSGDELKLHHSDSCRDHDDEGRHDRDRDCVIVLSSDLQGDVALSHSCVVKHESYKLLLQQLSQNRISASFDESTLQCCNQDREHGKVISFPSFNHLDQSSEYDIVEKRELDELVVFDIKFINLCSLCECFLVAQEVFDDLHKRVVYEFFSQASKAIEWYGHDLRGQQIMVIPSEAELKLVQSANTVYAGAGTCKFFGKNLHFSLTKEQHKHVFEPFSIIELHNPIKVVSSSWWLVAVNIGNSKGYLVGSSLVEEDVLELATYLFEKPKTKDASLLFFTEVVANNFVVDVDGMIVCFEAALVMEDVHQGSVLECQIKIKGMTCTPCSNASASVLQVLQGVEMVLLALATEETGPRDFIEVVESTGFGHFKANLFPGESLREDVRHKEIQEYYRYFLWSWVFTIPVSLSSMVFMYIPGIKSVFDAKFVKMFTVGEFLRFLISTPVQLVIVEKFGFGFLMKKEVVDLIKVVSIPKWLFAAMVGGCDMFTLSFAVQVQKSGMFYTFAAGSVLGSSTATDQSVENNEGFRFTNNTRIAAMNVNKKWGNVTTYYYQSKGSTLLFQIFNKEIKSVEAIIFVAAVPITIVSREGNEKFQYLLLLDVALLSIGLEIDEVVVINCSVKKEHSLLVFTQISTHTIIGSALILIFLLQVLAQLYKYSMQDSMALLYRLVPDENLDYETRKTNLLEMFLPLAMLLRYLQFLLFVNQLETAVKRVISIGNFGANDTYCSRKYVFLQHRCFKDSLGEEMIWRVVSNIFASVMCGFSHVSHIAKEVSDSVFLCIGKMLHLHQILEDVILLWNGTVIDYVLVWIFVPSVLTQLHKYLVFDFMVILCGSVFDNNLSYEMGCWVVMEVLMHFFSVMRVLD